MINLITMEKLARSYIMECSPYISGKPIEEVRRKLGLKDIIKLASNENPLGTSPKALRAIRKYLKNINLYPDDFCFNLRETMSKKYKLRHENFIIGNGSMQLLELICKTFINEGEELLSAFPSFRVFDGLIKSAGGKFRSVFLKDHHFDLAKILQNISSKTKIVIICNPNNPTGTVVKPEELYDFLEKAPKNLIIILDEAYVDFIENNTLDSLALIKKYDHLIILRSFSKIYGLAGLRIGIGITSPKLTNLIERARMPFTVNYLAQLAAQAALGDEEFKVKTQKTVWEGKKFLYAELNKRKLEYIPTQSNFIAINLKKNDLTVFQELLKEGVIILAGTHMFMPGYIRVTIGTREQLERFLQALDKVLSNLK
ncbi:MAG: histidinol-phosphate transaminase [Armatimonadetes bacterium]|nr:histidinol-phosphate transaminase [Armatimonadota bacterium]